MTLDSSPRICRALLITPRQIKSDNMAVYIYKALAVMMFVTLTYAQRPFYAGLRPVGYPALQTESISNRFGESADRPIEARGDGNLINRLDQMPADNQPFWYLNWRFYDAQRRNPQTYPQRPSFFAGNQQQQ